MIKISALNEDSSEESDDEDVPTITKEAQVNIRCYLRFRCPDITSKSL